MTEATQLKPGTRVRFAGGYLGTIDPTSARVSFTEHVVKDGDEGEVMIYDGQMPGGWIAVKPDEYPDEYVPVHPSMLEVIS